MHIHYTPTHASWLNQVELFFSILERRLLRRGEFASVDELARSSHRLHQGLQQTGGTRSVGPMTVDHYESRKSQ